MANCVRVTDFLFRDTVSSVASAEVIETPAEHPKSRMCSARRKVHQPETKALSESLDVCALIVADASA